MPTLYLAGAVRPLCAASNAQLGDVALVNDGAESAMACEDMGRVDGTCGAASAVPFSDPFSATWCTAFSTPEQLAAG